MQQNGAHIHGINNTEALKFSLIKAEREYVRYFDLFTSLYYSKNQAKRELAAKRYALLKCCTDFISNQTYTITEVFEVYKTFENASIKHYNSFLRKIKEFKELGATSCTHGRIGQNYQYKMNPYTNTLVFQLLSDPHYYSCSQITEWVNTSLQKYNSTYGTAFKTISTSTVSQYSLKYRNEITYYRAGKQRFDTATRPYLGRIGALHAGSLEQMDGTPVQMFCWNHPIKWKTEGKKVIRLNLFVLRDAYSGKITGFDLSESEDRFNIIEAMKMRVSLHNHLPAELVHDNFSASKTEEFAYIKQMLENKGVVVRAAKVGNAQDKGEVERFFGTFQSRFQRLIDGYLGEGIRSKRASGRISEEFLKKHQKQNGYYAYDEMRVIIAELVAMYNNSVINTQYGNKTPNQLYKESEKPYIKTIDTQYYIQMFWLNKTLKVAKSLIVNEVRKTKHVYEIWDNETKLKLNGKTVRVYYDNDDHSEIHVFSLEGEFICTCKKQQQIHEAFVDRQESENNTIIKHVSHREAIYNYIDEKAKQRVTQAEAYTGNTYEMVVPLTLEKEKLNNAESQALLNHFYDTKNINPEKINERAPLVADTPYHNKEKYIKARKSKGIHTAVATYEEI